MKHQFLLYMTIHIQSLLYIFIATQLRISFLCHLPPRTIHHGFYPPWHVAQWTHHHGLPPSICCFLSHWLLLPVYKPFWSKQPQCCYLSMFYKQSEQQTRWKYELLYITRVAKVVVQWHSRCPNLVSAPRYLAAIKTVALHIFLQSQKINSETLTSNMSQAHKFSWYSVDETS